MRRSEWWPAQWRRPRARAVALAAGAAVSSALMIAAAAVASGSPRAPPSRSEAQPRLDELPDCPGCRPLIADALQIDGRPARVAVATTDVPPEAVLDVYRDQMERAGLEPRALRSGAALALSAFSHDGTAQLLVGVLPRTPRGSVVTAARVALGAAPGPVLPSALAAAIPPRAVDLSNLASADGAQRVLTWREVDASVLDAAGRLRDALGRSGWESLTWSVESSVSAEFRRGASRVQLLVVPMTPGARVVLQGSGGE